MSDLRAAIDAVRQSGKSRTARCPVHDDRRASLSIGRGADGRVLFYCHAGCSHESVIEAAGMTPADLFEPRGAADHIRRLTSTTILATYDYRNERGELQAQVVRFAPKDFRQRRPDGKGGWIWSTSGLRPILYRLNEIQKRDSVLVVEGEKDADRLWSLGLPATCNAGGAGKWKPEHTRQLLAADVQAIAVLPDHDEAGRRHADDVARGCHAAGLRCRIVALPELPAKGDVSDWLDAGHTRDDLVAACTTAPIVEPSSHDESTLRLVTIGDLLAEPEETVDWLVEHRIAFGSVNIFAGKPKAGKSTTARVLAFEVGRGGSWLGFGCLARPVWYLALEDKRSEVRRHFQRMGATGSEPVRFLFRQPGDDLIAHLHDLANREQPGLIIVDTLQRLIKADNLNDHAEVTTKLTPILTRARETGAGVLLVHHAGKSERAGLDAVLGSTALTGSVDNVFVLSRTDRYRVLSSVQRIGPDLPETVVALNESGLVIAGPSRHEADVDAVERAFVEALKAGSLLRADLLDSVEARRQLKLEAIRRAVAQGTIIRSGAGSKADPHRFSLSGDSGSSSQVPAYKREPEFSLSLAVEDPNVSNVDSGSQVPTVPRFPREPESEPDESACPVCGRESCDLDPASCLREQSQAFRDLEDVFGELTDVSVEKLH